MAYYTPTENLLAEILEKTNKSAEGLFPSWEGKAWSGSGTTFNSIPGGNIATAYSASKYLYLEEMLYVLPSSLDYVSTLSYLSTDDLNSSNIGTILQEISSAYLTACGGTTSYIQIRKIDTEFAYNPSTNKYKVLYKISVNLWYTS